MVFDTLLFILMGMCIVVGIWAIADFTVGKIFPKKGLIRLEIFFFDRTSHDAELLLMGARKRAKRHKAKICKTIVVDRGMDEEIRKICSLVENRDGLFVFCSQSEVSQTINNIMDLQIGCEPIY